MRSVIVGFCCIVALLQTGATVIDLTGVTPRNRVREPMNSSASGGLVGGNGPVGQKNTLLGMTVLSARVDRSPSAASLHFSIELKNIGDQKITLPVNPNLADFEPANSSVPYNYISCQVTLRFEESKEQLEGASLYGSKLVSGSLKELNPGETVQIRARVLLKPGVGRTTTAEDNSHFVQVAALLLLQQNSVSEQAGVLHQDSMQIAPLVTSSNEVNLSLTL
jgi:hypothetical protein